MSVIVTDRGFAPDDWVQGWTDGWTDSPDGAVGVDLCPDTDPEALRLHFARIAAIRIRFAAFSDGRGFTMASRLRRMGFSGRLRAAGHVIADQYAMARRSGFDEVEIEDALADRQPEGDWIARADWQAHDYRARLRRRVA